MIRIRHLNCGTFAPPLGRAVRFDGGWFEPGELCCHCLLLELDDRLVLVDSGFGLQDAADPVRRFGRGFLWSASPILDPATAAVSQIRALGHDPRDVRDIIVTHLDPDHVGGLADFPEARVHVLADEHHAAMNAGPLLSVRFRKVQWEHGVNWRTYRTGGEPWFGFSCVRDLEGLPPEILTVPLVGHTDGHCAVAIRTNEGWLLHAGDAYFHRDEIHHDPPRCPRLLDLYESRLATNEEDRRANQARLRHLAQTHGDDVRVFCAHDPVELASFRT